jgi:hypothetical protein
VKASAALALMLIGCGGSVSVEDASVHETGTESPAPEPQPSPLDAAEPVYPDANYKPTCDDVGNFPGSSSCCRGEYCGGYCKPVKDAGTTCICAGRIGGCPWPFVCCQDECVGVQLCK